MVILMVALAFSSTYTINHQISLRLDDACQCTVVNSSPSAKFRLHEGDSGLIAQALQKHSFAILEDGIDVSDLNPGSFFHFSAKRKKTHGGTSFFSFENEFLDVRFDHEDISNCELPAEISSFVLSSSQKLAKVGRFSIEATNQNHNNVDYLQDGNTVFRLCYYPAESEKNHGFGAHTDTTFFTIIPIPTSTAAPGLQIFDPHNNHWHCVESANYPPGAVAVINGEFLEIVSDGKFRAGVHRVIAPPANRPRFSTPLLLRQASSSDRMNEMWKMLQIPGSRSLTCTHSKKPLIRTYDGLLTGAECREVIHLIGNSLETTQKQSTIYNSARDQKGVNEAIRTSSTGWLKHDRCSLTRKIADIASEISGQPPTHLESLQIARYETGQEYKLHLDSVPEFQNLLCGPRISTLIIYLNEDFSGGMTHFPRRNVTISPQTGRGLFFHNLNKDGEVDTDSAHIGSMVKEGVKFILTCWIHAYQL